MSKLKRATLCQGLPVALVYEPLRSARRHESTPSHFREFRLKLGYVVTKTAHQGVGSVTFFRLTDDSDSNVVLGARCLDCGDIARDKHRGFTNVHNAAKYAHGLG